jgi:hypothetical protein
MPDEPSSEGIVSRELLTHFAELLDAWKNDPDINSSSSKEARLRFESEASAFF